MFNTEVVKRTDVSIKLAKAKFIQTPSFFFECLKSTDKKTKSSFF